MLNPENVLALIDEVAVAKDRAARLQKHPSFTLGEKLDVHRGADQAAANRFDVVAQAYRELLSARPELTVAQQGRLKELRAYKDAALAGRLGTATQLSYAISVGELLDIVDHLTQNGI